MLKNLQGYDDGSFAVQLEDHVDCGKKFKHCSNALA